MLFAALIAAEDEQVKEIQSIVKKQEKRGINSLGYGSGFGGYDNGLAGYNTLGSSRFGNNQNQRKHINKSF